MSISVLLDATLVIATVAHGLAALLLLVSARVGPASLPVAVVASAAATAALVRPSWVALLPAAGYGLLVLLAARRVRDMRPAGVLLLTSYALLLPAGLLWFTNFVATAPLSTITRTLLLLPVPLAVACLPAIVVRSFEDWEPLLRTRWTRPRDPLRHDTATTSAPRVSIQVPAHAEPPEVVIATLDSLAGLDYPNFEVLVIDNNTPDEALWRPVEAHCAELGERFRFVHVDGLTGAKAGALNYALDHIDADVELIAVVDADYQVDPRFLAETVGFFDDETMGFVQTPHAYRDWGSNLFQRMCNFEYASFFATGMVSLNERNAGITVGTMCVIRKDALELAGRWATWCLTEDSELAVRIHAAGYSSVYLRQVYGRGLIPDTFGGYRKQRFRWTYGPVTELFRHYRLYLPGRWRAPSAMTRAQRIHHATHGLYGIATGLSFLVLLTGFGVSASMVAHDERLQVPLALWLATTLLPLSGLAIRWTTYRTLVGTGFGNWLAAMLATASLTHVVVIANLTAMFGRPVPWQRTDKFRRASGGLVGALSASRAEIALAVGCVMGGVLTLLLAPGSGVATMLAVGFFLRGLLYTAAPVVAVIAERSLRGELAGLRDSTSLDPVVSNAH